MAQQTFNGTKINVEFEESASRQQLNSGENIATLFGKIKKIFSDLKAVCFSGSYKDLNDIPSTATSETDGLMSASDKAKLDGADDTYASKSLYGDTTINVGRKAGSDVGKYSTAEGSSTTASGAYSHAEGHGTTASGIRSHAEGFATTASGEHSHAEGIWTISSGNNSHAEGSRTTSNGGSSHIEGVSYNEITDVIPNFSSDTTNNDIITVWKTKEFSLANGTASHVEGKNNLALGYASHAEGCNTVAIGDNSHTSGCFTKVLHENEAAYGKYNESNENTLFSIGDGTADDARHNAFEITTTGGKLHDKDIATLDDIPASLPANGGNADTVDSLHANEIANNTNLLINPDFAINQRDNTEITIDSSTWVNYFIADRWKLYINNIAPAGTIKRNSDNTITLSMTTAYCDIRQVFETRVKEGYYTLSAKINGEIKTLSGYKSSTGEMIDNSKGLVLGNNFVGVRCPQGQTITIEWVKLEQGRIPTNYVSPNIADEMTKCLRYYEKIEYPTSSGLAAVQWKNDVNSCSTNVPFFTKRIKSPTVTIARLGDWRFVSNTGVITISSGKTTYLTPNNVGVSFTLASATSTPSFGWVDRFLITIDAEL